MPDAISLVLSRSELYTSLNDGFEFTVREAMTKDNHYTLFRYEDWPAWVTFTSVFIVLLIFDQFVLNRTNQALTMGRAIAYTLFWIFCAFCFCGWVWHYYGESQAYMWMSGYMLEWMLSFDNLFVFHMIFSVYQTPDYLKHRPLYLGIWGAIIFRLAFIFIGEYLMHAMFFMHLIFGAFLIYTGFKTLAVDDDDDDPSQHPAVQWLQSKVPFVSAYDSKGAFFVKVPLDAGGQPILPAAAQPVEAREAGEASEEGDDAPAVRYGVVDFDAVNPSGQGQLRVTMLFLVVCCLEISDLLFAVDSVSAIVAQVNDLFLAYTSAVFAMLGLRATFFIIDVLAKVFSLLKYGVAAVLVFIGVKLCLSRIYHIHPSVVCGVLVTCIAGSMIASVVQEEVARQVAKVHDKIKGGNQDEQAPLLKKAQTM